MSKSDSKKCKFYFFCPKMEDNLAERLRRLPAKQVPVMEREFKSHSCRYLFDIFIETLCLLTEEISFCNKVAVINRVIRNVDG